MPTYKLLSSIISAHTFYLKPNFVISGRCFAENKKKKKTDLIKTSTIKFLFDL